MDSSRLNQVLLFWFDELSPDDWFRKSEKLDRVIAQRFGDVHQVLSEEKPAPANASQALAQVIVLDQFSRNMFRDSPHAFAQDGLALELAEDAIAKAWDVELADDQRAFLYMPFMHSEDRKVHERALDLFAQLENSSYLLFEQKHKAIIDRFGRYPHRNEVLARASTEAELAFLQTPDSAF